MRPWYELMNIKFDSSCSPETPSSFIQFLLFLPFIIAPFLYKAKSVLKFGTVNKVVQVNNCDISVDKILHSNISCHQQLLRNILDKQAEVSV